MRREAQAIMDDLALDIGINAELRSLSVGRQQMVEIARAVLSDAWFFVMDEPTTLLDLRNKRHFAEVLRQLRQQVVLVTHDLELLHDFDRVVVLDHGRVVADDEPAEALTYYRKLVE